MLKNTDKIKRAIVDGCRRGVCDHNGGYIPVERMGRNGKGSHYIAPVGNKKRYNREYIRIFRHD